LLAVALVVPAPQWIEWLNAAAADPILLQGATVFRLVLAAFAAYVGACWLLGWRLEWRTAPPHIAGGAAGPESIRLLLPTLLVFAVILRLIRLDSGMWLDEVVTMVHYAGLSPGEILTTYDLQNQHFLYSILAHWCVTLFGFSSWALRLPAVGFGVAGVWALVLLGREISGEREALWAAALLVVSPQHVWLSQNARGYTAIFFFSVFGTWLFLRALREGRVMAWWAYGMCVALGAFSHQSMLFVVAGQVLVEDFH